MVRRINGRSSWFMALAALVALAVAGPALAQSSGMIKGIVTDEKGQPVEGAKITIVMTGGTERSYETKTDKKGQYIQIGLATASWKVTAEKDKLASKPVTVATRANSQRNADLVIGIAGAAATAENAAKAAELKKLFDEGVALSSAGKHKEAVEKFTAGIAVNDRCFDCYDNIGFSYAQLKDWDKAEAAYKQSTTIRVDDSAAWSGLATAYNAQRKFDLANEASANATKYATAGGAAGSGNADALYNQAVILFNQGKPADAKPLLEQAVAANPGHADAHYLLGMALVGIDPAKAVPEFEAFLKLSPTGPADKVKMANDILAAFKK